MRDIFKIEVKKNRLINSFDMLRYDMAYRVEDYEEEIMTIWSMFYTPKRWESFGVRTKLIKTEKIKNKDFDKLAQLDLRIIEDKLKE